MSRSSRGAPPLNRPIRRPDQSEFERVSSADSAILVSATVAAQYLAISPRKLWSLTACGEVPSVRIGRSVRYMVADLQAFADRHRRPSMEVQE